MVLLFKPLAKPFLILHSGLLQKPISIDVLEAERVSSCKTVFPPRFRIFSNNTEIGNRY